MVARWGILGGVLQVPTRLPLQVLRHAVCTECQLFASLVYEPRVLLKQGMLAKPVGMAEDNAWVQQQAACRMRHKQVTRAADAALRVLLAPAGAETGSAMHMQKDAGLYQTDGVLCWK